MPLVHKGLVPCIGERVGQHIAEDGPEYDDFVGAVAQRGVCRFHGAHKRRHYQRAAPPAAEHRGALAHKLGGIAAHLFDRLAERQDVVNARLRHRRRLGQRKHRGAESLYALFGEVAKRAKPVCGAGDLQYHLLGHIGEHFAHFYEFVSGMPVYFHHDGLVRDVQVALD